MSPVNSSSQLLLLPALAAQSVAGGRFALTQKFIDGVTEYARCWPGKVQVAVRQTRKATTNLDEVNVHPDDLPFGLQWMPSASSELNTLLTASSIAMITMVDKNLQVAAAAEARGVPVVWVTEYSLKTRKQIICTETTNPLLRWRREWYNRQLEAKFEKAIARAAGVQCNGTPTDEAYRPLNPRTLLYFDTRVRQAQVASLNGLNARISRLMQGGSLRLAFSGRLIPMKGADHLPQVAGELRRLGVPFTFQVCGGGPLEPRMKREAASLNLENSFQFRGVLDFESELMPFIANEIDLFVCPHRQGDPSCTYLETMSCGTPIVGYDNEALAGLVRASGVGWTSPIDQPQKLAGLIAKLNGDRRVLAAAAARSLEFAAQRTFEHTMQSRIDHLLECAQTSHQLVKAS